MLTDLVKTDRDVASTRFPLSWETEHFQLVYSINRLACQYTKGIMNGAHPHHRVPNSKRVQLFNNTDFDFRTTQIGLQHVCDWRCVPSAPSANKASQASIFLFVFDSVPVECLNSDQLTEIKSNMQIQISATRLGSPYRKHSA